MAIRSTFYDTTPGEGVKETGWALSARSRGTLYGVASAGDLKLTAHPTTPYAVNLSPAAGFWGHGIWDESTGTSLIQSVAPVNDAVRWDLIACRRDWQPTGGGPTSFISIPGGSTAAIPAARENRPGVVDDQPLYLVKWKGGQTQPQEIIDLRCWASNGGVEIVDKLALSYLETPGAAVKLGADEWRCEYQGNGVWGWGLSSASTVAVSSTWVLGGLLSKAVTGADVMVSAGFMCTYPSSGGAFTVRTEFQQAFSLANPGFIPRSHVFGQALIVAVGNAPRVEVTYNINPAGEVHVRTLGGSYTMVAGDRFYVSANWAA